uniref:Transmembrane protein n=1 Tax=Paramoeba aestuarina TaxID=180227 RepID=A0A7S4L950_9EUKA|mmetsp:Transcript_33709/g.52713  ORF Transcript_33709/g.52713 Transcript_33709/m.52713 type:complete len:237 (+) Transcript_33709:88-798(+)
MIRGVVGSIPLSSLVRATAPSSVVVRPLCASNDTEKAYRIPSLEDAGRLPIKFRECDNETIFNLSIHGVHGARKERLLREVMVVDKCDWSTARQKVFEMDKANDTFRSMIKLPYQIGVFGGLIGALSSIPLVFYKPWALWFNEKFVHADLPDGGMEELDASFWNVGSWTWGWMEPYLGTASFVLLGLQFTRAQMQKIQWKPYTEMVLSWRANRLAHQYPQYNRVIVRDFSKSDPWD